MKGKVRDVITDHTSHGAGSAGELRRSEVYLAVDENPTGKDSVQGDAAT